MTTKTTYENATTAFAKLAGFQQVADLLNLFLSCEDNDELTDFEVEAAMAMFEDICELRPECVKLAQGAAYVATVKFEEAFHGHAAWVARDENGSWRCYCAEHFATDPTSAIAVMYHANEVAAVGLVDNLATAVIETR